ncbi:amidohydrolase family protein [Gordonia lacunae]|uniref:Amidohydrolase-related domain-containing protein n=1 Tax=Gordonia lacunae TaxID=417102 RepID=A0A243Q8X9_9ACTN|nr:amidohydrolase family protein [Gordonia lacunae]OUC78095.1 hypothetical protein CA982_14105 [Gordonia lacunae]
MPHTTVFEDVRLFDGESVVDHAFVTIRGQKIDAVTDYASSPTNAETVNGRGCTLMPGLIDSHAHAKPGALEMALSFGVTTEIDLGSDPLWMDDQRAAARTRDDVADVRSSSFGATVPNGHPSHLIGRFFPHPFPTVSTVADAGPFVEERVAEGADFIKMIIEDGSALNRPALPALPLDIATALVDAAHAHNRQAFAHVTAIAGARRALDAGIDALVHLFFDQPADDVIVQRIVDSDVFVVPTLVTLGAFSGDRTARWLTEDPRSAHLLTEEWKANLCCGWPDNPHGSLHNAQTSALSLHRAGARVLVGTDAASVAARGTAHGASMHDELRLFVDAGFTPLEALRAATSGPADAYGLSDRGRVATGLQADLVLVEGDPTTSIDDTLSIRGVWRRGTKLAARRTPISA